MEGVGSICEKGILKYNFLFSDSNFLIMSDTGKKFEVYAWWNSEILQNSIYFWNKKTHFEKISICNRWWYSGLVTHTIPCYKSKVARNEKWKNFLDFFKFQNMGNILLGHFIKHKLLISEEHS